jgi:hypothetical protein
MSEHEPDQEPEETQDESDDEFVKDYEEDPSTAGHPDEPGDELRGG